MQKKNVVPLLLLLGLVLGLAGAFNVPSVEAHGERTQSPFLRMRTVLYHDTHFSTKELKVNEELVITGRFRIFEDWPESIHDPELAYLNVGVPGPRFIKTAAFVNGVFADNGFRIEQGGDYDKPVQIGEFNTANIRFLDDSGFLSDFIKPELEFEEVLALNPEGPILPGETKAIQVTLTSPLWSTQRLTSISEDPESRFGGLLTFYDPDGNTTVVSVGGTLFPIFA